MNLEKITTHFKGLSTKVVAAGEIVLYQGEIPRNVMILRQGLVKIYSISSSGEERIVDFAVPGETLATSWVFGNATSTLYYYHALEDCEIYELPKASITEYLQIKDVASDMLAKLASHYTASLLRITALEQARARDKILFTFYYLLQRFGREIAPDWYTIQLSLTHQIIADLVGLTRETTAVELNTIKRTKVLSYKRQKYLVHKERLLKAIGEDSFANISL